MKRSAHPFRFGLREARYIVGVAIMAAVTYNLFASTRVSWIAGPERTRSIDTHLPTDLRGDTTASVLDITTAQAKRLFDQKAALFIDARPTEQFEKGHIPGAINVYAQEFPQSIPTLLPYLSKDSSMLIVTYCGGGLCPLSHELAEQLNDLGFTNVRVYVGGTDEWQREYGYPISSPIEKK